MLCEQFLEQFGDAIRRRRKGLGLTQWQLAERLGIWPESISRIECGKFGRFSVDFLLNLSEALELNLSTLVREAEGR